MKKPPLIDVEHRLEHLTEVCRSSGMRMTHQRMEIFREVAATGEHPDADTIFKRVRKKLPMISHDTVYRTLASLEEAGLINRVDPACGRARFDANTDEHHHFICKQCGSITDVYLNIEPTLPEGIETIGSVESLHLQIRGVCKNCKTN